MAQKHVISRSEAKEEVILCLSVVIILVCDAWAHCMSAYTFHTQPCTMPYRENWRRSTQGMEWVTVTVCNNRCCEQAWCGRSFKVSLTDIICTHSIYWVDRRQFFLYGTVHGWVCTIQAVIRWTHASHIILIIMAEQTMNSSFVSHLEITCSRSQSVK